MKTLKLEGKKVTNGTAIEIAEFVYANKNEMSNELKLFYQDVKGLIDVQLSKKANYRMSMGEILERAFNIEKYVMASGAVSFETKFIR